jgi:septum formation protein
MSEGGKPQLILASGSQTRAALLRAAGLVFDAIPARVDEPGLFAQAVSDNPHVTPAEIAMLLARAKALDVSGFCSQALVIGADQVLAVGSAMVFKAADRAEAKNTLLKLRGREHTLHSAAVLATCGTVVWSALDAAHLTMRNFSAAFLEDYLDRAGDALTSSAGAYHVEGQGANLFDRISGAHATILGLPLLPLLAELRLRRVLLS